MLPTCHGRNLLNQKCAAPLRRPRKADSITLAAPTKTDDVSIPGCRKSESTTVTVPRERKAASVPVSKKADVVLSPPPIPTLPLCTSAEVSGPDKATLLLLRELLSRVQYSADEDEAQEHIYNLYRHVKLYGKMLDGTCKGEVDSVFAVLRDLVRDTGLAYLSRLLLLELIELRAAGWGTSAHLRSYYARKLEKFPEIKFDDLCIPSNIIDAPSLAAPKGFSPRDPVESVRKEQKNTCQETITVCKSRAFKVFESDEKVRRLEDRCRAELECYPDADGEDCLVRITAENQKAIDRAVSVIELAIEEVEHEERHRRHPPQPDVWNRPPERTQPDVWNRPPEHRANIHAGDSWGKGFSSYQDKIAARTRYTLAQGNGKAVPAAPMREERPISYKPVKEETKTTFLISNRHKHTSPTKPAPKPVPVYTQTSRPVQDDLDWDDIDNTEPFVWSAQNTLASEVNRLAAVKEPNTGFNNQQEVPAGKIKTKKTKQNAPSTQERQNSTVEVIHKDRTPSYTTNGSDASTVDSGIADIVSSVWDSIPPVTEPVVQRCDMLKTSSPISNGPKGNDGDMEKTTSGAMWAGWVDDHIKSPKEFSEGETSFFLDTSVVDDVMQNDQQENTTTLEVDSAAFGDTNTDGKNQESFGEHISNPTERRDDDVMQNHQQENSASLQVDSAAFGDTNTDGNNQDSFGEHISNLAEWRDEDIYYSDEDDFLSGECEQCCSSSSSLPPCPQSPDVIIEEEYFPTSPTSSHTTLGCIQEEKDIDTEDGNNNNKSNSGDAVNCNNNNNNNNDKDIVPISNKGTVETADICNCSTDEEIVDISRRLSLLSIDSSPEKGAAVDTIPCSNGKDDSSINASSVHKPDSLDIQGSVEKDAAVEVVTFSSTKDGDEQDNSSMKSSSGEKPGFPDLQGSLEKDAAVDVMASTSTKDKDELHDSCMKASRTEKPGYPDMPLGTRPQFRLRMPKFLVNTIRQPILPVYYQIILDRASAGGVEQDLQCHTHQGCPHLEPEERRFLFAKTAKLYYERHPEQCEVSWKGTVKRYSRDVLLRFSHSPACHTRPAGLPALPCVQ